MNPKISVIVPVYKVEEYLKRCVDSILNQTFTDFECILVDDGSPDNCGMMCDEYAKLDKRVKVIHKQNGGLSDARNSGIEIARGEYFTFIDSDDWIHPSMVECLYAGIKENNVLCSVCGFERTTQIVDYKIYTDTIFSVMYGLDFLVSNEVNAVVAWGKIYHRSLFDNIKYPVGKIHEDEFTTYRLLYKAGDIAYCDNQLYYYFQNSNGITKSKYCIKHLDAIEALEERDMFFRKEHLENYRVKLAKQLMRIYWDHYIQIKNDPNYKHVIDNISKKMRIRLIADSRKVGVTIKKYANYYEIAFPRLMKIYWLFMVIKDKLKGNSIYTVFKSGFKYLLKK